MEGEKIPLRKLFLGKCHGGEQCTKKLQVKKVWKKSSEKIAGKLSGTPKYNIEKNNDINTTKKRYPIIKTKF